METQDMRRSIIANLINRSQPDQMRQRMQNRIGQVNFPGYTPLNMPGQPMPQAQPKANNFAEVYRTTMRDTPPQARNMASMMMMIKGMQSGDLTRGQGMLGIARNVFGGEEARAKIRNRSYYD